MVAGPGGRSALRAGGGEQLFVHTYPGITLSASPQM